MAYQRDYDHELKYDRAYLLHPVTESWKINKKAPPQGQTAMSLD